MIELDVHRLKTGELVVIHDAKVDRTTNGTGRVAGYTLERIKTLDAGSGEAVPLLSEVFDLVDKRVPINIELKGLNTAKPLATLLRHYIMERSWSPDMFVVSSFNHVIVQQFMLLMPNIEACALIDQLPYWTSPLSYHRRLGAINFNAESIRQKDVERMHRMGKKIYVYTVDSSNTARYLEEIGVDGIFTNLPDVMKF
jgi:glycerophosphoryl diester phosphodiesterase